MLSQTKLSEGQKVLDLGCGYGIVGIVCAKIVGQENVYMTDIDPLAIQLSSHNAEANGVSGVRILESDGFTTLGETGFDLILSNPPYHSDFKVAKLFIEKGFNRLKLGGQMLMVTKRKEWYKRKFISIFGGVMIYEEDGYFVFSVEKRGMVYAEKKAHS